MSIKPPHNGPHKLQRFTQGSGRLIWKCILPGCGSFFTRDLLLGRTTLCHRCDGELVIGRRIIKDKTVKPVCDKCIKRKADPELEQLIVLVMPPKESPL